MIKSKKNICDICILNDTISTSIYGKKAQTTCDMCFLSNYGKELRVALYFLKLEPVTFIKCLDDFPSHCYSLEHEAT